MLLDRGDDVIDRQNRLAFVAIGIGGSENTGRSGNLRNFAPG
jgi:hypothetical protein